MCYTRQVRISAGGQIVNIGAIVLCALPVFIGAPSTLGGLLDPGAFNEVASGEQAAKLSLGASLFNGTGAPTLFGQIQVDVKRTGDGAINVFDIAAALSGIPLNIQVAAVHWELRPSDMGELKLAARENERAEGALCAAFRAKKRPTATPGDCRPALKKLLREARARATATIVAAAPAALPAANLAHTGSIRVAASNPHRASHTSASRTARLHPRAASAHEKGGGTGSTGPCECECPRAEGGISACCA